MRFSTNFFSRSIGLLKYVRLICITSIAFIALSSFISFTEDENSEFGEAQVVVGSQLHDPQGRLGAANVLRFRTDPDQPWDEYLFVELDGSVVSGYRFGSANLDLFTPMLNAEIQRNQNSNQASTLFQDSFADPTGGWCNSEDENSQARYRDGEFSIQIKRSGWLKWCWAPVGEFPSDFVAEVDVYQLPESIGNYGIIWGKDNDNFYIFSLQASGQYRVRHRLNDTWMPDPIPLTNDDAIRSGASSINNLKVAVQGEFITIIANDIELQTIQIPNFGTGRIGLVAGSGSSSNPGEVRFDNFSVENFELVNSSNTNFVFDSSNPLTLDVDEQIAMGAMEASPIMQLPIEFFSGISPSANVEASVNEVPIQAPLHFGLDEFQPVSSNTVQTQRIRPSQLDPCTGDCKEKVAASVENLARIFRRQGADFQAIFLEKFLDEELFAVTDNSTLELEEGDCIAAHFILRGNLNRIVFARDCFENFSAESIDYLVFFTALQAFEDEKISAFYSQAGEEKASQVMKLLWAALRAADKLDLTLETVNRASNIVNDENFLRISKLMAIGTGVDAKDLFTASNRVFKGALEFVGGNLGQTLQAVESGSAFFDLAKEIKTNSDDLMILENMLKEKNWQGIEDTFDIPRECLDLSFSPIDVNFRAIVQPGGVSLPGVPIAINNFGNGDFSGTSPFVETLNNKEPASISAPASFNNEQGSFTFSHWIRQQVDESGQETTDNSLNLTDPRVFDIFGGFQRDAESFTITAVYTPAESITLRNVTSLSAGGDTIGDTKNKSTNQTVSSPETDIKFAMFGHSATSSEKRTTESLAPPPSIIKLGFQSQSPRQLVTSGGERIHISADQLLFAMELNGRLPTARGSSSEGFVYQAFLDTGSGGRVTEEHPGFTANYTMSLALVDGQIFSIQLAQWDGNGFVTIEDINGGLLDIDGIRSTSEGIWIAAPLVALSPLPETIKTVVRTVRNQVDGNGRLVRQIIDDWPNTGSMDLTFDLGSLPGGSRDFIISSSSDFVLAQLIRSTEDDVVIAKLSPNGQLLVSVHKRSGCTGVTIRTWEVESGRPNFIIDMEGECVVENEMEFSPDGQMLAISRAGRVQLWNPRTGESIKSLRPAVSTIAFSADGKFLAGTVNRRMTYVWDVASGEVVKTFATGGRMIDFHPDGAWLAIANDPLNELPNVVLWNWMTDETRVTTEAKRFVKFSEDGSMFATVSTSGNEFIMMDFNTFGEVFTLESNISGGRLSGNRLSLDFSSDGQTLIVSTFDRSGPIVQDIAFWNVRTREKIGEISVPSVLALDLSGDSRSFVTGSEQGIIRVWRSADVTPDADGDGVSDRLDFCPNRSGTVATDGC